MKSYVDRTKAWCRIPNWTPHTLPDSKNADGRPVWEPPILEYSAIIGEEFVKKRKAMMEYTGNDVVKTTQFMDVDSEYDVLLEFETWAEDTINSASDLGTAVFFYGLYNEIVKDKDDLEDEWVAMDGGCIFVDSVDDEDAYSVQSHFRRSAERLTFQLSVRSIEGAIAVACLGQGSRPATPQASAAVIHAPDTAQKATHPAADCHANYDIEDGFVSGSRPSTALPLDFFYARPLALQISALNSHPPTRNASKAQVQSDLDSDNDLD